MALRAFVRAAPTWLRPPLARRLAAAADLEEVDAAAPAPDPLKHAPSVFDKMCGPALPCGVSLRNKGGQACWQLRRAVCYGVLSSNQVERAEHA